MSPRLTVDAIRAKKSQGEKITMLTAYDFSCATWVDRAGVDVVLVGDSLGMVMLGYKTTAAVTMVEMLHHARAVCRAVTHALVVGDLPKEALDAAPHDLERHARSFLGVGCGAVKIEWRPRIETVVRRLTDRGIAVMGHVGLTPQSVAESSGFHVQGRTAQAAVLIVEAARKLEAAGCFSLVLECVPEPVAAEVTRAVGIPTIGIGAGPSTDGQVLVLQDVLGLYPLFSPKFVKKYTNLGDAIVQAVEAYRADVIAGRFPATEHAFTMDPSELQQFRAQLAGPQRAQARS